MVSDAPNRARYVGGRLLHLAREMRPAAWPVGGAAVIRSAAKHLLREPAHPYTNARSRGDSGEVLAAVMNWLAAAQDRDGSGGVPAYWSVYGGWGPPYPETTGYIVPTMLAYADHANAPAFVDRARRAGDWLLGLQRDDGAFPGGVGAGGRSPSVFNSGQILFGLNALADRLPGAADAAIRTGDWLLDVQSADGAWRLHTYQDLSHVYYTMVAWALAELAEWTGEARYGEAAIANVHWALADAQPNGWLPGYNLPYWPNFLHFIAYALQGALEVGLRLDDATAVAAVKRAAERLLRKFELRKSLAGAFDERWRPTAAYECLTGNAQTALVWLRLYGHTGDPRYLNAALKLNERTKATIALTGPAGIRGGVQGSQPIWGRYLPLRFPNWAAKFTADALIQEREAVAALDAGTGRVAP